MTSYSDWREWKKGADKRADAIDPGDYELSEAQRDAFHRRLEDHYVHWRNMTDETMPLPFSQQPAEDVLGYTMERLHAVLAVMDKREEAGRETFTLADFGCLIEAYMLGAVACEMLGVEVPGLTEAEEDEDGE